MRKMDNIMINREIEGKGRREIDDRQTDKQTDRQIYIQREIEKEKNGERNNIYKKINK